jgi:hypothetical protein
MKRHVRWIIGICLLGSGLFFLTSSIWKENLASSTSQYVVEHMELIQVMILRQSRHFPLRTSYKRAIGFISCRQSVSFPFQMFHWSSRS